VNARHHAGGGRRAGIGKLDTKPVQRPSFSAFDEARRHTKAITVTANLTFVHSAVQPIAQSRLSNVWIYLHQHLVRSGSLLTSNRQQMSRRPEWSAIEAPRIATLSKNDSEWWALCETGLTLRLGSFERL
jgi:hypothetical protein